MRLPFMLERLFPDGVNFDPTEWGRLKLAVKTMVDAGSKVILDPHNKFRFYGEIIGTSNCKMSYQQFADTWAKLAKEYKNQDTIIFGLMNEPYGLPTADLMKAWKVVIKSIRDTGA